MGVTMKALVQILMTASAITLIGCNDERNPPAPIGHDPDGPGLQCHYNCPDLGADDSTTSSDTTTSLDTDNDTSSTSCGETE